MKLLSLSFSLLLLIAPLHALSQVVGPIEHRDNPISQNSVSTIVAYGDTVWASPSLNRNIGNSFDWFIPNNADSVVNGKGRVFSYAVGQDTVIGGIGFSADSPDGSVPAGYGFYISTDGGENWRFSDFPLDEQPPDKCISSNQDVYTQPTSPDDYDPDCDIIFTYGGETYTRIRTTVAEQSPPYNTSYKGDVIFAAAWGSGLLRSTDLGESWERVILPPSTVKELTPENSYSWRSVFGFLNEEENDTDTTIINRYDPRQDDNLLGFGTLIDSQNRVWFGSAGGINISENGLTAPIDSISWKHISFEGSANGLLGNWIIAIKEQLGTGRIWMTNWIATAPQNQGLVYTEDGGETFKQMLIGERINDIGFKDGYVFATGNNGLFISRNGGDTWVKSPQIKSPNTFIKSSAVFLTADATTDRIWIGTEDGIVSHECCAPNQQFNNWEITRVDYPLSGGNVHDPEGRDVSSYAYPNPFSASVYEVVRIKFEVEEQSDVNIRIFDFGMNLVREIESDSFSPGTYEAVWDGYDGKNRKVANGPYFYVIEMGDKEETGKILVVD